MRKRWKRALLLAGLLSVALLAGCSGKPLPEGMDEQELLSAGQEIVELLSAGEYQQVCDRFRSDIREGLSAEDVSALFEEAISKAGEFEKVDESRTTGSDETEPHGIAELYCDFSEKDVRFRIAFDPEMNLIGLDPPKLL